MNHLSFYCISLLLVIVSNNLELNAQPTEERLINQKSIGGFISTGFPLYELEEGTKYNPFVIGAALHLPLYRTQNNFGIGVGFLPQLGFVPYDGGMEYELGFNISFNFTFQLSIKSVFSVVLGTGPHYITANIGRQSPGFIFSDHFNLAYRQRFGIWEVGLTVGVRHISNAGLENPNLGIENLGLGISVRKLL